MLLKCDVYAEFDLDSEVTSSCVNGVSLATYSIHEMLMNTVKRVDQRSLLGK